MSFRDIAESASQMKEAPSTESLEQSRQSLECDPQSRSIEVDSSANQWGKPVEMKQQESPWGRPAEIDPTEKPWGRPMEWANPSTLTNSEKKEHDSPEKISPEQQQDCANKVARDYNEKYHPYERALQKGYHDVKQTENGGVSFEDSKALYCDQNGNKGIVKIEATGRRTPDFDAANKAMGFDKTPEGYVWHHVDDYDVKTNTVTLQLVKSEVHNATKPHSGGCAQYDAVHGPSYNKGGA